MPTFSFVPDATGVTITTDTRDHEHVFLFKHWVDLEKLREIVRDLEAGKTVTL